ncbi:hypothetical protein [Psychrobacillus sp. OK028]|uniref:hypothetical protein n=1 Tax=Psychrobacillus sp. OK028 TaxID=1884359 RepID=UPI001587252D|nr:hypothetical protein [Psychrobacillus sp. OK028]
MIKRRGIIRMTVAICNLLVQVTGALLQEGVRLFLIELKWQLSLMRLTKKAKQLERIVLFLFRFIE